MIELQKMTDITAASRPKINDSHKVVAEHCLVLSVLSLPNSLEKRVLPPVPNKFPIAIKIVVNGSSNEMAARAAVSFNLPMKNVSVIL